MGTAWVGIIMSSLKYLRAKGVRYAWAEEIRLVKQGKGSREWDLYQQHELLTTGRVKGFIGHHIQSVSKHPELACEVNNIQFLTREEHKQTHLNNWKYSLQSAFNTRTKSVFLSGTNSAKNRVEINLKEKYQDLSKEKKAEIEKMKDLSHEDKKIYSLLKGKLAENYQERQNRMDSFFLNKNSLVHHSNGQVLDEFAEAIATRYNIDVESGKVLLKEYRDGLNKESNSFAKTLAFSLGSQDTYNYAKQNMNLIRNNGETQSWSEGAKAFSSEIKDISNAQYEKAKLENNKADESKKTYTELKEEAVKKQVNSINDTWSIEDKKGSSQSIQNEVSANNDQKEDNQNSQTVSSRR